MILRMQLDQQPLCERCDAEPATMFFFNHEDGGGSWRFVCGCHEGREHDEEIGYLIHFSAFFGSANQTIDWMAQLNEKSWSDPDSFFAMMTRLRETQ